MLTDGNDDDNDGEDDVEHRAPIRLEMTGREIRAWRRNRKWDGDTAPDHDRTMQRACTEFEQFRLRNTSDASTFRFPPDGGGDRRMRAAGADLPSPPADWIKISLQTTFTPFLPADAPSAPSPADALGP